MAMKIIKPTMLALSAPTLLIGIGASWHHLTEWDLTQPQATLIAGLVGGPFLIAAAAIAFRGQAQTRQDERDKFEQQLQLERENFERQLREQRGQVDKQIEMQARIADATNATVMRAEEQKHRREVTFNVVSTAMTGLLELRLAFLAAGEALDGDHDDDFRHKDPTSDDISTPRYDLAAKECQARRNDVNAAAATLLIVGYKDPHAALVRVTTVVENRLRINPNRSFQEGDITQFENAYNDAVDSLRDKYDC
ncbi:hypothetical protein AB0O58_15185 [Rhodococcus sp. NPDC080181]|uniref:hypothetical protein n=1 Tax=Rhodococcus sp. NPDC080181 TaxID=3155292 RepID=UPI00344D27D4